ncbi:hypothetical protein DRP98_05365 [candidate division KSB1 bacterium]|nr:MAG: hypothetical protein DRP98_05365 [candidate division KSB1 bacterium]
MYFVGLTPNFPQISNDPKFPNLQIQMKSTLGVISRLFVFVPFVVLISCLAFSISRSYADPPSGFPTIYDTTILYTEVETRPGYSILVPSTTASGWWREEFLFSDLDSYNIRIKRYRNAFVAAIMQPELTQRLKTSGHGYALLRDLATDTFEVVEPSSELSKLLSILKSGQGIFDLRPNSIQTTLQNWQEVVRNKHISQSLGKLSQALGGVALFFRISSDVLNDIFLHAIANAMVLERMECLEEFLDQNNPDDPAVKEGFRLAKQDVQDFLDEDVSVIQSILNSFQSHGAGYLVTAASFLPAIAQHYGLISGSLAASITRVVLPYYLAYNIGVELFAELEDMQSMCAAATLNDMLSQWTIDLEVSLPDPSDPSYQDARRMFLTTVQLRYGIGYWYNTKYDEILNINFLNPSDWIKFLIQNITGTYPSVLTFRAEVLQPWMNTNYNHTVEINPYLGYYLHSYPAVVSHRQGVTPGTNIYVTFSEDMDDSTFTNDTITVSGTVSGSSSCSFSFDHSTYELTIDPLSDFSYGETVTVTIGTGVKDLAGNSLASPYTFNFIIESAPDPDPTSLDVTAIVTPNTNVPADSVVNVNGTATYNTGGNVPVGTVTIDTGESVYTAAIDDGVFNRNIHAPSSDREISITVDDDQYNLSKTIYRFIDIKGDESGHGYTLHRTTTCRDVQGSDPIYETKFFRRSDTKVVVWLHFTYLYRSIRAKWEFYEPDGTLYYTYTSNWTEDPQDHGYEYYYWWRLWAWINIDGYLASYRPGRWTCKIYVDDGGGWDYKKTEFFTIGYEFTEHRMAKDVETSQPYMPIDETNVFYQTDMKALTWANADNVVESFDVKWEYYEPNGSLYDTYTFTTNDPGPDRYYEYYRFWSWTMINGYPAASKCGDWHVDVFIKDAGGSYQRIYRDYFQILEKPAENPDVSVTSDPSAPIEGQSINLCVSASDNTYLKKITLYWNDGSWHNQSWDNIYASSYNLSHNIGSYSAGQLLEYYAVAWDTSGNKRESEHHTITAVQPERVSTPNRPSGEVYLQVGQSGTYTTGGSSTSFGHSVEYQFDWGDGTLSDWGSASQSHSWSSEDFYFVKAHARCQIHTNRVSGWSSSFMVTVDSTNPIVEITTNEGNDYSTNETQIVLEGLTHDPEPSSGLASVTINTGGSNEGTLSNWRFTVNLNEGDNTIVVTAKDNAGNLGQDTIKVTKEPGICPIPDIPSNPNPENHATNVSIDTDLNWSDCANTDSYDVYFGTSPSPPYYGSTSSSSYSLPTLSYSTHYYWKIVAKNNCGNSTPGPVWDFTTGTCTYSIYPTSKHFGTSGGTDTINVTTQSGCAWTALSNVDWITITAGSSGTGSGIVYYSVSENSSTSSRTGTITIADQTFTVTQSVTSAHKPMPWLHLLLGD